MCDDFLTNIIYAETTEDRYTEAFAALLRVPDLRRAWVLAAVGTELGLSAEDVDAMHVETQGPNEFAAGYPDMKVFSRGTILLVENKLAAGFTKNQPGEYLKELREQKRATGARVALVIQAPAHRLSSLRDYCEGEKRDGDILAYFSWERTAELLGRCSVPPDSATALLRDSFGKLVRNAGLRTGRQVTAEQYQRLAARDTLLAVAALEDTVLAVAGELKRRGRAVKQDIGAQYSGFYVGATEGNHDCWFGISYHAGLETAQGPLWLQAIGDISDARVEEIGRRLRLRVVGRVVLGGAAYALPVTGGEEGTVVERLVSVVEEMRELLRQ